jgi:Trk K+ transport system NAD-binding subunit
MVLSSRLSRVSKTAAILLLGYGVFLLSALIRTFSHDQLPFEVLLEPLLITLIGGFLVSNFSQYRAEFSSILASVGPAVYILFFTLTGASLALDVLVKTWPIALALFVVRIVAIFIGSFAGGTIAGNPLIHNRISWMAYVTQAGVGLGLAKEVAAEFPEWGAAFATVIISVIVLNQVLGPPLFKWAINRVGEARSRATPHDTDGVRDVIIFGLKAQSLALAHLLRRHDWQVKLVSTSEEAGQDLVPPEMDLHVVNELTLEVLKELDAQHADAVVSFLPDESSYQVCELVYEHFGIETVVVRLKDRTNYDRFQRLGVRVVDPQTAVVSLLEHSVRSPIGTSLLLGSDDGQEMVDMEVRNPRLHGVALRDIRLPLDVLVLSVRRGQHTLLSRGYIQFQLGDKVTMVGPKEKLREVMLRFDA